MRLLIFSLFLTLQGCVGVGIIHDETTHAKPINGAYEVTERGSIDGGNRQSVRTKDELRLLWGEPDAIWSDGKVEKWRYNKNISWAVFMPMLIIPIPLGFPTGHSGVTITFEGSDIVSLDADQTSGPEYACGYLVYGFGCVAGSKGSDFHGYQILKH